jgi:hypothetical protein
MRNYSISFVLIFFFLSCSTELKKKNSLTEEKESHEVYELRIYYTHEGKFNDILSRFNNHTTKLFEKHGFTNVGYWTTLKTSTPSIVDEFISKNNEESALLYIVSFPNMEFRDKAWKSFRNDPEWEKAANQSRINGPIVKSIQQIFLNPTSFSNLK